MQTESLYQNQILFTVPAGLKDLSARKLDLDRMTEADPATMQALYLSLADDFDGIGYSMVAGNCRRRAAEWQGMIPAAKVAP